MQDIFTMEQIRTTLAERYRSAYGEYYSLENLAAQALRDDDRQAHAAIGKRAALHSRYIAGIRDAALALGVSEEDFMSAVNADREVKGHA